MPYPAVKLITNAYYLSNIVSPKLQTVDGPQISSGMDSLNALLSMQSITSGLIPYYTPISFTTVPGKEKYDLENLISVDTANIYINALRLGMRQVQRDEYFGTPRVHTTGIPYQFTLERTTAGASIYIYFIPSGSWEFNLRGKVGFDSKDQNYDMELIFNLNYITYLEYALAEYICSKYSMPLNEGVRTMLNGFKQSFEFISPPDITVRGLSAFSDGYPDPRNMMNFYQGWV